MGDDNKTNPYNPTAAPLFFIRDVNIFSFMQLVPSNHNGSAMMPLDILQPRHPHIQSDWNSYICYGQKRITRNVTENDNVLKLHYCMKTSPETGDDHAEHTVTLETLLDIFLDFPIMHISATLNGMNEATLMDLYTLLQLSANCSVNQNNKFTAGTTVLGSFILSCEITDNGLQFFGEIKELIALAVPVALFPQPTYYELQYK
ncbi:hypothetical protein BGW80DRAFT_1255934 [Lactifluus volemus]|nr:hypothetical protein BGW80DRAFT_1255934 [Lactifluus volemus]